MKVSSSKNNFQFSDNEYGWFSLSANQNTGISANNPVKLDTQVGNITFNPATYQVTLKKNRTYKLLASLLGGFTGNTGLLDFRFYNVTAGSALGSTADQLAMTYTGHAGTQPCCYALITPTVDTVIELRITVATALSLIYASYSFVEIQQINIVSPVIQDISTTLQAGIVMAYTGTVIPVGWLNCDGSAVSRTVYNKLFASISTTWGAGNGSTTFNLPDLRSATLRGVGTPTLYTGNTAITLAQTIDDAFQGHHHLSDVTYPLSGAAGGAVRIISGTGYPGTKFAYQPTTDGTNGTPRTGLETTGKARGVFYIIKY